MKRIIIIAMIMLMSRSICNAQTNVNSFTTSAASKSVLSSRELYHKITPGIVRIEVYGTFKENNSTYSGRFNGTGWIIAGGYIVTNYHVVAKNSDTKWENRSIVGIFDFELPQVSVSSEAKVLPKNHLHQVNPFVEHRFPSPWQWPTLTNIPQREMNKNQSLEQLFKPNLVLQSELRKPAHKLPRNKKTARLTIVGLDDLTDLAVLKLSPAEEREGGKATDQARLNTLNSQALTIAQPSSFQVGDRVAAIGFAKSIEGRPSFSIGVISGLDRSVDLSSDMIQTDAAINPGNSGGPLLNLTGQVIGVNTSIHKDSQNIGYSRSVRTVQPIIDRLVRHGQVNRLSLGITIQALLPHECRCLGIEHGVIITKIYPESFAQKAGLKEGDIITNVNDQEIKSVGDYLTALVFVKDAASCSVTCGRLPQKFATNVLSYLHDTKLEIRKYSNGLPAVNNNSPSELSEVDKIISLK